MSLSEILHFKVRLSSGKCKSDILVCYIYSSSAISIPNSLSLQVNTMFFSPTASTASSACYLRIKLCSFCLLKHCQLQSFWNQTLTGNAVGEEGELSATWLAHPWLQEREREKTQTVLKLSTYASGDPQRTRIYSTQVPFLCSYFSAYHCVS